MAGNIADRMIQFGSSEMQSRSGAGRNEGNRRTTQPLAGAARLLRHKGRLREPDRAGVADTAVRASLANNCF
jgi:hypothetical protein